MRRVFGVFLSLVFAVAGLLLGAELALVTGPIYFHMLFADYPDPAHPGHLRGVTVSTPEWMAKRFAFEMLVVLAVLSWRWAHPERPNKASAMSRSAIAAPRGPSQTVPNPTRSEANRFRPR